MGEGEWGVVGNAAELCCRDCGYESDCGGCGVGGRGGLVGGAGSAGLGRGNLLMSLGCSKP